MKLAIPLPKSLAGNILIALANPIAEVLDPYRVQVDDPFRIEENAVVEMQVEGDIIQAPQPMYQLADEGQDRPIDAQHAVEVNREAIERHLARARRGR